MKTLAAVSSFALAALAAAPSPAAAPPASINGDWKTEDGKSVVRFYDCGANVCGKVQRFLVAEPAGGAKDTKNPDKSKRDRKILGINVFWGLSPDGDDYEGKGYSPEDGRLFNAQVKREGNKLRVRGCVAVFCKTQMWTKA